jgi:hypothetical protein
VTDSSEVPEVQVDEAFAIVAGGGWLLEVDIRIKGESNKRRRERKKGE